MPKHQTLALLLVIAACGGTGTSDGAGSTAPQAASTQQTAAPQSGASGSAPVTEAPPVVSPAAPTPPADPPVAIEPVTPPAPAPVDPSIAIQPPPPPPTSTALTLIAGAPTTPAPAPTDPAASPPGGSGSSRFQMGAAQGLYVVDPTQGEAAVQGFIVVTSGPIGSGNFIPPADATVTINGVALLRDPNLNGAYWRVDPAGPQPQVGSGGELVVVASATLNGKQEVRTLVLPCPSDVAVAVTRSADATTIHLSSASNLTVNVGIPLLAGVYPTATVHGYDPASDRLVPGGAPGIVTPGPLELDLPLAVTSAPAYLLDLRWPGPWIPDGESGAFCGLAKRWGFGK